MRLTSLTVEDLRNLSQVKLQCHRDVNIIYGANASGKTSLLEAISLLSTARSFRVTATRQLIQQGKGQCLAHGEVAHQGHSNRIGVCLSPKGKQIRINGQRLAKLAELASSFPLQILHPGGIKLLEQGPKCRRQFLDWGVFHVEPVFLEIWRRYARCLKQRNAALRARDVAAVKAWEPDLVSASEQVHQLRSDYAEQLTPIWQDYSRRLFGPEELEIRYHAGWDVAQPLQQQYQDNLCKDRHRGYTSVGAHRGDMALLSHGIAVQEYFSRGQQKLLICALRLAQAQILKRRLDRNCVFLIDDLPAELDEQHRRQLLVELAKLDSQIFVTSTDPELVPISPRQPHKMFHVKHGQVEEVV